MSLAVLKFSEWMTGNKMTPAYKRIWIISNLVGRSHQPSRCPGKRAGAEDKKGRDQTLPFSFFFLSAKRRGGKGIARQRGAEARIGERGTTAFFGEANAFLPGH